VTAWRQLWQDSMADMAALREHTPSTKEIVSLLLTNRGTQALLVYRVSHLLWQRGIPAIPDILTRAIQILYSIDISYQAEIGAGCVIFHGVGIVIATEARIGPSATIYQGVTVGARASSRMSSDKKDGCPVIGARVFMGAGAKILGGVIVGDDAVIGANAVVTSPVAGGVPAIARPRDKSQQAAPTTTIRAGGEA